MAGSVDDLAKIAVNNSSSLPLPNMQALGLAAPSGSTSSKATLPLKNRAPLRAAAGETDDVVRTANKKKKDAPDADAPPQPFIAQVENYSGKAGMAIMAAQMGVPIVAGGLSWAGRQTNIGALHSASGGLKAVESTTFAQLGEKTGIGKVAGALSNATMSVARVFTNGLHALGITDMVADSHARAFEKHAGNMQQAARGLFSHNVSGTLGTALADVKAHLAQHPGAIDYTALHTSLETATAAAKEAGHAGVSKSLAAVNKSALRAGNSLFFEDGYRNLSHYTKTATGKMAGAGILNGAMQATFVTSAGIADVHLALDLNQALRDLKTMEAGLSGRKPEDISGMGLLFGQVSEPTKTARAELFKEFGPSVVLNAANSVLNIKFVTNGKYGGMFKSILLLMAVPMADAMVFRGMLGSQLLPAYSQMKTLEAKGQDAPQETVAKLLGSACGELHARGGAESNFAKALALFYTEHHAKADVILKEVENGTVGKRIAQLQREYDAYLAQHPEVAQEQAAAKQAETTHVDRLKGGGVAAQLREVVGAHTESLHKRAGHEQAHAAPGVG